MKLRLHIFIGSLRGGGAERVCVTLANAFADMGVDVHLLVLNLNGSVYYATLDTRVSVTNLGIQHTRWAIGKLWHYVREERPDTALVFAHELAVLLVLLRTICRLRYTIVARNVTILSRRRELSSSFWHKHVVDYMVRRVYGRVDHIIAQSQGMAEDLTRAYGIGASMVTVINNPVAPQIAAAARTYPAEKQPPCDILFIGRLAEVKGLKHLLSAFSLCLVRIPELKLWLVGDGPLRDQMCGRAQELGIAHAVRFEGFATDIAQYYRRARVLALTSLYEGFPNVVVEALTFGVPAVAFDCPSGPREIIRDGVNGFLVPLSDDALFADKLMEALRMDWDREAIRQTVQRYTVQAIGRQYYDLITSYHPLMRKGSR